MPDVPEKTAWRPCAPDELFPSRESLADVEDILAQFRLDCEDRGLWPGSLTLPELQIEWPGRASAVGGLIVLWSRRNRLLPEDPDGWRKEPLIIGWSPNAGGDILQVQVALDAAIERLMKLWTSKVYVSAEERAEEEARLESIGVKLKPVPEPGGYFGYVPKPDATVPPVPPEVAAVLDRCTRRLRMILEDGPTDAFIPSEREQKILTALDGRALTLDELAAETGIERSGLCQRELKELKERGLVDNARRLGGYFRPDAPPIRTVST